MTASWSGIRQAAQLAIPDRHELPEAEPPRIDTG